MTLSTHYTKDALESIFATAQKAEFMGIISAYREHKIINGKTQPLSEQENYYRHKFLGLMLNERDIDCASFCALSRKVKKFMPLFIEFANKPLIKKYVSKYSKLFND